MTQIHATKRKKDSQYKYSYAYTYTCVKETVVKNNK